MASGEFLATLLRTSAGGFAGLALSRTAERVGGADRLDGGFEAWREQLRGLALELAAALEDGAVRSFAEKVGWTGVAYSARGRTLEVLRVGLDELEEVLKESLPEAASEVLPAYFEAARGELDRELDQELDQGLDRDGEVEPVPTPPATRAVVEAYLEKLEAGDGPGAIAVVTDALAEGRVDGTEAIAGVLNGAMREVGRRWHVDAMQVAQEHFATQVTGRLLERLIANLPTSPPNGHSVLLAMAEGDAHELGLRIVAALFELDGWRTICLGADMPAEGLPRAVEEFGVDLLLLGATLNTQREAVGRTLAALRAADSKLKILVGGPAFAGGNDPVAELGADGCATSSRRAVELGRQLLQG